MKQKQKEGYTALQLGAGSKRGKQVSATQYGHFQAADVSIKRNVAEFRVSSVGSAVIGVADPLFAADRNLQNADLHGNRIASSSM